MCHGRLMHPRPLSLPLAVSSTVGSVALEVAVVLRVRCVVVVVRRPSAAAAPSAPAPAPAPAAAGTVEVFVGRPTALVAAAPV